MRQGMAIAAIAFALTAASAWAADPLIGTWKLNPAQSKGTDPVASQTETIEAAAGGYTIEEDVQPHPHVHQTMRRTAVLDGQPHKVEGVPANETETFVRKGDATIQGTITIDGKPFAIETLAVSADGKTLTWTTTGPDGSPDQAVVAVYERQ